MANRWMRLGPCVALTAAGIAAALSACAGATTTATSTTVSAPETQPSVPSTTTTPPATRGPEETQGAFVFRTQCAGCHGTHGEGNLGPSLVGIADRMTEADQQSLVRSGLGRMPPFSPGLSDADIAAVVAYTRTQVH
jgi:mono/diheme cytochrome c family protein